MRSCQYHYSFRGLICGILSTKVIELSYKPLNKYKYLKKNRYILHAVAPSESESSNHQKMLLNGLS